MLQATKHYEIGGKAIAATSDTMAAINRFAIDTLAESDVFVGEMALANDQYDRSHERFTREYLARFAETLPGRSVLKVHDHYQDPVGRFFDAEVRKADTGHYLHARYFMDAKGAFTPAVRMGIAKHVSIGYTYDTRTCDLCGKDYDGWKAAPSDQPCNHIAGRAYDGKLCTLTYSGDVKTAEAVEGSFVALGCQFGAETLTQSAGACAQKAAHFDAQAHKGPQGDAMDPKEVEALQERLKAAEAEATQAKALAADGEAYRAHLKAEIVRLHTSMEQAEAGAALVKALDAADVATLDAVRKEADARHAKHFNPRPGANTDGAPKDQDEKPKREFNPRRPLTGEGV